MTKIYEDDGIYKSLHLQPKKIKLVVPSHETAQYRASSQDSSRCLNGTSRAFLPCCINIATRPTHIEIRLFTVTSSYRHLTNTLSTV